MTKTLAKLEKLDEYRYLIPQQGKMLTSGLIYASSPMLEKILEDRSLEQVANVATLPGIVGCSLAMPDIHWGYGFPIGGVAAFSLDQGVISPGGVGYDINCGVRLLTTGLSRPQLKGKINDLISRLFAQIPAGVGSKRKDLRLGAADFKNVLENGAAWAVEQGYGEAADLSCIESSGIMEEASASLVSSRALERGRDQLGTLGSGNHFVEVGYVAEIFDETAASVMGLFKDQGTAPLHTGSRGLGHQVCDDYIKVMLRAAEKYGIYLADRQLCCAPLASPEARDYFAAMSAAANFAFANRQILSHWVKESFLQALHLSPRDLDMNLVYDVAHNIAKKERHRVGGKTLELCVHRKGATRAFPAGHPESPERYASIGQPVIIPGDMGRYSYVLVGTQQALEQTFGSTCHGAGRLLSRHEALKKARGRSIAAELEAQGVSVRSAERDTLEEEMPEAYKDVEQVVQVVQESGISKKVAKLRPLGVVKG